MSEHIAVWSGTRNMYADILPSIKSMRLHARLDRAFILIEDDEFPEPLPDWISCINVTDQPWIRPGSVNWDNPWTWMVMMRGCLANLFPQYDKVLSIDADAICVRDMDEIFDIELGDRYYMAAALEPKRCKPHELYFNAGVSLHNLALIRERRQDEIIINALNKNKYAVVEQDCLNLVFRGAIRELPPEYNDSDWTRHVENPRIIHYAAVKKWQHLPPVEKYRAIRWEDIP